eukprot:scaffold60195_cov39-Prasinocladus_malaysianus.AAC.1
MSHNHRLEFMISGGQDTAAASAMEEVDKPLNAPYYTCPSPGGYKLVNGRLIPFKRATEPPMMLVSDLDGTMVGETFDFDMGTQAFKCDCSFFGILQHFHQNYRLTTTMADSTNSQSFA